jgi:regulator of sigma D
MPKAKKEDANKRPLSRKLIDKLVAERQQMLVLLWELTKLDFAKVDQNVLDTLEDFQEILVDYIAAGHFGLYQRIIEGSERRQSVLETAADIYARIEQSTDVAVEFTERYDAPDAPLIEAKLAPDLSRLAEEVSTRIELEDRLILALVGGDYAIPRAHSGA